MIGHRHALLWTLDEYSDFDPEEIPEEMKRLLAFFVGIAIGFFLDWIITKGMGR